MAQRGIVQSAGVAAGHDGLITAVDQASDGIVLTDREGTIQYVNPAFTVMTGYSAEEAVGQNPRLLKSGRHGGPFYAELWKTLLSGQVWQGEVTNRRKDGTLYEEEMRIAPVWDAGGVVTGYIAIKHDVTERRAQVAAQAFLAAIAEHSEDAMIAISLGGAMLTWNHGAEAIFGFTAAEAVGRDVSLFTPEDRMPRMMACIDRVGNGEVLKNYEGVCQHADGRRIQVTATGFPIRDASGAVVAAVALLRDSTERHRTEQRLRESEERFRTMADGCPSILWVTDAAGNVEFVNRAYRAFFGIDGEGILADGRKALFHPADAAGYVATFEHAAREHLHFEAEARVRAAEGTWRLLGSRAEPRFSPDGVFLGHVGLSADITDRREAEQALLDSRQFAQSTIDALSSHICVLDEAGTIIAVNRAWRDFARANCEPGAEETASSSAGRDRFCEGANYLQVCDRTQGPEAAQAAEVAEGIRAVMRGEQQQYWKEYPCDSPSERRWFLSRVTRFFANGLPRTVAEHINITERKQAEQALEEARNRAEEEARHREFQHSLISAIHEVSPDGILVVNDDGNIVSHNKKFIDVWGLSPEEIAGEAAGSEGSPPDQPILSACVARVRDPEGFLQRVRELYADTEATDHSEIELNDGRTLECHSACLRGETGRHRGRVWFFRDITGRKQAEQALQESEERFRIMADSCPIGIWVTDATGGTRFANRTYRDFSGIDSERIEPGQWKSLIHPDDAPEFFRQLERSIEEHTRFAGERRSRRADGDWRWVESYAAPRFSPSGEFLGLVGASRDITDRKQAEQALERSEEKFRQLAENIREVFWMMNAEGTEILYVGPAYESIWGRTCRSLYEKPMDWLEAIHREDREQAHTVFLKQLRGESIDSEYRILTPDGREKWIRDRAFPVRDQDGDLIRVAGIAEEITERKRHEAELIQAREDADAANQRLFAQHVVLEQERTVLRTLIDNVPDLMYVKDLESRFVVANIAVARFAGAENPADLLGKTDSSFFPAESARRFCEDEQRLIQMNQPIFNKDETVAAAETGDVRCLLTTKVPILNREGQVTGIAGIGRDITQRKEAENALLESNRRLQEATARANELVLEADAANRAKSRFLANMSHEIRTPMNGVIGMNQLLAETGLTPEQRRYVEVAQDSGRTLLALIDDILDLSKIESGKIVLERATFDLSDTVEDVVRLLSVQAGAKGLRIEAHIASKIPRLVRGDAHRLRQVLTNLCANAIKFTAEGGVTVEVEPENRSGGTAGVHFAVSDTGIGIDAEKIPALFSPFFQADASTTRRYGGTGLGLAISKQLVEKMGGRIGVESGKNQGSTFWFTVAFEEAEACQCEPATLEESAGPANSLAEGHGETILVAEDNFTNREVIFAQLKKLGYKAHAVANGAEAVEACGDGHYDLLLMDCAMPVMDGYEATRRIRQLTCGQIPIIALTASAMAPDRERCLAEGMDDYLTKPVELGRLAKTLARWIAKARSDGASAPSQFCAGARGVAVFDGNSLLRRLMGDRELAGVVLKAFREDVPRQLKQLRSGLAGQDAPGVRLHAHALKGAAANVGGEALRGKAHAMEMAAEAGDLTAVAGAMPELEATWLELEKAIGEEWDGAEK